MHTKNTIFHFSIAVTLPFDDQIYRVEIKKDIAELPYFLPINFNSAGNLIGGNNAKVIGRTLPDCDRPRIQMKRKQVANLLAHEITEAIMTVIENQDTFNGWAKEDSKTKG